MENQFFKEEGMAMKISDDSFKILDLKKQKNKVNFLLEEELEKGIVEGKRVKKIDVLAERIKESLKKIEKKRIKNTILFSLPEEFVYLIKLKIPRVKVEELKSAVCFAVQDHLPLPIQNLFFDFELLTNPKEKVNFFEILFCGIEKEILSEYSETLKKAKLFPIVFEPESLSLSRCLIKDGFSSNPILIVEITEDKTNFVVHFKNSVVDSTTIPISSNLFTEILAKSLNVSKKEAEDLKKTYGLGEKLEIELKPEKPAIFSSLVGPLVDLAEQIKNFIIYYQSHDSQAIKKILLAGKEANLKGLKEFLKKELNLEVELGNPFVNLPSLERDFPEEKFLEISSLLGLAMRAI